MKSSIDIAKRLNDCKEFFEYINDPIIKKNILDSIDRFNQELPSRNFLFFVDSLEKYIDDITKNN